MPFRITFWFVIALLATAYYLHNSPIFLDGTHASNEGTEITREAGADVVIVIDYDVIRKSGPGFEDRDWSATWINMLEQEIGPVTIATPKSLSQSSLNAARIVILTSSVTAEINNTLLETLRPWVLSGNLLILDQPEGRLREIFSANGRAGKRRGQNISFARELAAPYQQQIQQMPLSTSFVGSTAPRDGATTLLSIDGAPVIYAATIGQGTVVTVDFDLGEQLVALQQGRPTNKFNVRSQGNTPRTEDLVLDKNMIGQTVPFADLLERYIVYGIMMQYAPLPMFWTFPDGANGSVVLLHEDTELGDGGGWMLEYEANFNAVSTLLTSVDSGLTTEGAETMNKKGGEVGLLWRLEDSPAELREPVGIGSFKPAAKPVNLEAQLKTLKGVLPVGYVRSLRTADGWWSEKWSAPFEVMATNSIRVDSSYAVPTASGFAFGTGLPYQVFNAEGIPLGVRELPIVVPAQPVQGPEFEELLQISAEGHHQALTVSIDPALFADFPDAERFERWLAMFDSVKKTNHELTSISRFDAFQRSRRAGSIKSRLVEKAPLPENVRSSATAPAHQGSVLRINIEAKSRGMHLVVPQLIGSKKFLTARQAANRVRGELISADLTAEKTSMIGIELQKLPLAQGFNSIDVYYH